MCPRPPSLSASALAIPAAARMAAVSLRRALDKRGREDILVRVPDWPRAPRLRNRVRPWPAAAEIGLDLSGHLPGLLPRLWRPAPPGSWRATAGHAAVLTGRFAVPPRKVIVPSGGIPDPFGGTLADYRRTRDTLAAAMDALAAAFCSEFPTPHA